MGVCVGGLRPRKTSYSKSSAALQIPSHPADCGRSWLQLFSLGRVCAASSMQSGSNVQEITRRWGFVSELKRPTVRVGGRSSSVVSQMVWNDVQCFLHCL